MERYVFLNVRRRMGDLQSPFCAMTTPPHVPPLCSPKHSYDVEVRLLGCLWIAFLRIPRMRSTFETARIHGCVRRQLNWRHRDTTKSSRDPLDKELVCTSCRACKAGACIPNPDVLLCVRRRRVGVLACILMSSLHNSRHRFLWRKVRADGAKWKQRQPT